MTPSNRAILIIHQDASPIDLRSTVEAFSLNHLLIVSTHQPYPSEVLALTSLAQRVDLVTFADLLDDQEMAACDEAARHALTTKLKAHGRRQYARHFMENSRRLKNERVLAKVRKHLTEASFFHLDGLGIDSQVWLSAGSIAINSDKRGRMKRPPLLQRLRRVADSEINLLYQASTNHVALVLGSIRRIALADGVQARRIIWPLDWGLTPPRLNAAAILLSLRVRSIWPLPSLHTTIHQYSLGMSKVAEALGAHLHIVADGHHPANYPASYIEMFGSGTFVVSNPLSANWFLRHGRQAVPRHWFQASQEFCLPTVDKIRIVMLALNHAGDWSALIERSDTDRLILAFIELARAKPELEFVIRPHPTMSTPEHEGRHALMRIKELLGETAPPNLSLSNSSLEDDLQRADLYLSEYSQVLIDAWSSGKLGATINLTKRRSFMADYEALGFLSANSPIALEALLDDSIRRLPELIERQSQAIERFNAVTVHWRETGTVITPPSPPSSRGLL